MELATSKDGTSIAFWRNGVGPPLLLVHGATADHTTTWRFVGSALEEGFTVCAMDRRGRGASGDSTSYALAREAEDIVAVVHALRRPVRVVGHSFGALCAIEAALLTGSIERLVLYEGVPLTGADLYPAHVIARLDALVRAGDADGALVTMFRDVVGMPAEDIEAIRAQHSAWTTRLANVPTIPRELRAETAYVFDRVRFAAMTTPTLLLVGGASPSRELAHARAVAAALPRGRVAVLPGQQHAAMYTAPDLFVREVVAFLSE